MLDNQFEHLITPFPASLVKKAPQGKYGNYVAHHDVNQAALRIVGPHDFKVIDTIRGYAPLIKSERNEWPARENAIVGCLAELSTSIDGLPVTIIEVGTEDNPAMHNDAENLKNAASDAYKRCWMRLGLGLHLWAADGYWLKAQYDKDRTEGTGYKPGEEPFDE